PPTCTVSTRGAARPPSPPATFLARTVSASPPTRTGSTWWCRGRCRARSACSTWSRAAPRSPMGASSSTPGRASRTACAATPTAISGSAGAAARGSTASRSTIRTPGSSAASCSRSAAPTSASAGPSATGSSSPRASRSTRSSSIPRAWPAAERPRMALPTGLRAFRHADFRRFFAAQFVAQVGSWMQTVAQSWLVLQLTSSPLKLGLIGTLQFGPILLFSIVSGAVADRVRKRRLLLLTQSVLGGQALLLGALVYGGHVEYWHVAVLATGVGFANVLDGPARQSFVAEMVGRADVGSAISLNSACFNSARIVGPSIGGLIIGRYGIAPAFALNAIGFAIAIVIMLTLRARGLPQPRSGQGVAQEILIGIRYVRR